MHLEKFSGNEDNADEKLNVENKCNSNFYAPAEATGGLEAGCYCLLFRTDFYGEDFEMYY